ncbi:inactive tyrosine-protein kinase PEAK1 isoform X1 [Balaenoptera acutorostrata]|uniref:Inactive tyrosine-protein kinase PEAK1 isoform X1 n=1 Tax=Balaenoptera acutorostrata TaxID=9767 RepID=A0A384BEL2_BALAC|nr:inactive tyrosine-protein kinase PEAK1 isoform X1 [Balaenoptera acutorostrata]XP_007197714.2 inactive tyrosine-protein kinase PEAK1 isoform X1 [Balaenoptera acutorostrata]XP_007197715.2 inactive tyrosine-protein kinase PEAK1 isoform X1 [Balaenoptera acutorostrata]XP_007197716.2 inactive tyrosine-protein kinase PEAK1 isoform X1 [Balaenoptera acutorostrata]XP_007197717.2 inactive tyrosine-protein kinase PEAK1 isoform X1 [Balaenoptera acutorostrata]XP_007197718.2 inactive tyrosine-protein kina
MSACNTFTEHVWKPGECKNCFKPKSLHQLPPDPEKAPITHGNKTNANHSNNHRIRNTGNFRPPVAKKPTIAVKPTMMVADGQSMCGELSIQEHCENKPVIIGWNRNRMALNQKPLNNNNEDDIEGLSHVPKPYGNNDSAKKVSNNNSGLTEVLKEIAGLDTTPQIKGNETNSRETFLGRINDCYKRSLERKLPPSCMMGGIKDTQGKHVILSGSTEVISNEGGRFCYPEFSSGEESEEDVLLSNMEEEHESWDESDEELLAMEIRMRGQPRFANFRANTLSPVRFFVDKKWNTVPLRNKSLQRICAVDYDDSYDEILNGYEENSVVSYGPGSIQSMVSSDSTSPDSSLTEESRSETASSLSQKICNVGIAPGNPGDSKDMKESEPNYESLSGNNQEKDSSQASKSSIKVPETHKAVLALRLEEKDGKIAVQTEKQESKAPTDITGQSVTINLVPVEEQAKPYRVVNLEQPLCKPYTVVDVSAAMASEHLEGPINSPKTKSSSSTPNSPVTSPALTSGQISAHFQKSSAIRYQEVWTSSTSPRQKIPKVELVSGGTGPNVPPRKNCHKSAPTSPTATNVSSKTIPVKSPNLSEIKFNSYNNAGMPPFPIIIHDEPTYARSSKNAIKVPIVINPNAYDNLAIYKSFLGTSGELSVKEKTTSVISHTYEEIETESKVSDNTTSKPTECPQAKGFLNSTERKRGSVAQKVQEFNSCLNRGQSSPQRSYSSSHSSPTKLQRTTQEPVAKTESTQESQVVSSGSTREKASTVLSQIVASIQPPQSPPEMPQSGPKACSVEELYAIPPDASAAKSTPKSTPVRPKSLFTSQPSGEAEAPQTTESPTTKVQKDPLTKPVTTPPSKLVTNPQSEPPPPFPPPRSTSSPYHASNLLQRHFTNWTKPTSPTRSTEAESVLHSEGSRRAADAKPKRWISFKSFFRRRKTDEEDDKEKDREKGKLVGLDGTVIHMLPPPPVQRHHWFTEAKGESSEKPAIVFMYRCDPAQGQLSVDQGKARAEQSAVTEKGRAEDGSLQDSEKKKRSHSSPSQIPKKILSHVTHEVTEDFSPRDPSTVVVKQDGGGCTSVTPALPLPELEREEEKGDISGPMDPNPCSATYSNLGQSRAAMIPPKHPRQPKGASDDAIAFGGKTDQEAPNASQPTPPPLPKKMIIRANTEPISKDLQKSLETTLCVMANPTYDIDPNWDASSAGSSISYELKGLDIESYDSLERPLHKERPVPSAANSISSLTTLSIKDRFSNSTESLSSRRGPSCRQGRGIQKPQRQALYRGLENREEVVGKIRSLHTDALKKLAIKCEDLFMAGQKDQLRFGVDSWSDFRLTSDKPCCEAGDAVYYTASYAKDPLNNYAVKICKSKAKESQQYYHSLAVRQSLAVHFNIQQDCGHFLAEVPKRLLPWEDPDAPEEEEDEMEATEEVKGGTDGKSPEPGSEAESSHKESQAVVSRKQRSHVVVITREVPCLTVADFVRDSLAQHGKSPDVYERQVCLLLLQLCSGLEHLKPYHVTHCDLRLENLLLVHYQPGGPAQGLGPAEPGPTSSCPTRLIVSNFSQAKQKSHLVDPEILRDQSRLAPEIITATQYKKCDEFQTGILIYEMLHLPNPFDENPELKEKEYTRADLPHIPLRSPYSRGLQQLASCLLNPNPSERLLISGAKGILQCLLWGPREGLFQTFTASPSPVQRNALLQNWLDIKRTLLMIKFAEKSLDREGGVSLEDWLCAQYLAFATPDSLSCVVKILQPR